MALLEVKNLNKYFKDFHAVRDLNFSVNKGDVYGFLGPNGAGKSTTLRMVLGLIYPTSGEIYFKGERIEKFDRKYLQNIGALIERPDFYENLSALSNLRIFARLAKLENSDERIEQVLHDVKLFDRRKSRVKTFSQGMKQRLGIAQALLHEPELIILDEPSNGLDPQGQADMRRLIHKISKEMNITIVISSHILAEIEQICNRMVIINHGLKIKEGGVKELMHTDALKIEIRSANLDQLQKTLTDMGYQPTMMKETVQINIAESEIPGLTKKLADAELGITEIRQLRTLEEYFLNLTK